MRCIVFVSPPLTLRERYGVDRQSGGESMPLGLAFLAGVTRHAGYETHIVDSEILGLTPEETCDAIMSYKPDVVGFTAVTISVHNAATVARLINNIDKKVITLLGGHHISAVPKETMKLFPEFNIGVLGEGEATIVELLATLKNSSNLKEVKGLVLREGDSFLFTGKRERVKDLDSLPLPAWDLLPKISEHYCPPVHTVKKLPASTLVTSRGCPGQCVFCARIVYENKGTYFSAGRVMDMVNDFYYNYGIREIQFRDDNFTVFRKRLLELCKKLKNANLDLVWSSTGRVDTVTPEVLKAMKEAGCWQIWFGIESGSQRILDLTQKGTTIEGIRKAIKWTREAGIKPCGFFIIGHPGETKESIQETIKFGLDLDLAEIHATFMTPFPGSDLYLTYEKYGIFENDWKKLNGWTPMFVPHGLTREELKYYSNLFYKRFFFRPKVIISYLLKIRSRKHLAVYLQGFFALLSFLRKKVAFDSQVK